MIAGSVSENAAAKLRGEPLTDEHCNWIAGGEAMNKGDECWFVASVDLDRAPRLVRIEEVACYSDRPEVNTCGALVGSATIQAAPTATANGSAGRLVLTDLDAVALV